MLRKILRLVKSHTYTHSIPCFILTQWGKYRYSLGRRERERKKTSRRLEWSRIKLKGKIQLNNIQAQEHQSARYSTPSIKWCSSGSNCCCRRRRCRRHHRYPHNVVGFFYAITRTMHMVFVKMCSTETKVERCIGWDFNILLSDNCVGCFLWNEAKISIHFSLPHPRQLSFNLGFFLLSYTILPSLYNWICSSICLWQESSYPPTCTLNCIQFV